MSRRERDGEYCKPVWSAAEDSQEKRARGAGIEQKSAVSKMGDGEQNVLNGMRWMLALSVVDGRGADDDYERLAVLKCVHNEYELEDRVQ